MSFEKLLSQESKVEPIDQDYEANFERLEKAKEIVIESGIFQKEFLDELNFYIIGDFRIEDGHAKNFELTPGNELIGQGSTRLDWGKDVSVLSESLLKKMHGFEIDMTDVHASERIWWEENFERLYSFDAVVVHEIAHAKSFQLILPSRKEFRSEKFDKQKFAKLVNEVLENEMDFDVLRQNIDFSKFRLSLAEWSEIYAMCYQREFLRRENEDNEQYIEGWDKHILHTAKDIPGAVAELNKSTNRNVTPEMMYQENHTLSFLVAQAFEKKFENFDDRIKALESCKKQD